MDYEKFLNNLKVQEVKDIVRSVLKHIKIKLTGAKKADLIEHLLKHTYYEDGEVVLKEEYVENLELSKVVENISTKSSPKKLTTNQIEKKKEQLIKEIGKNSGIITRTEREYNDIVYDSYMPGEKGKGKRVLTPKDKVKSEELQKELKQARSKVKELYSNLNKVKSMEPAEKTQKKVIKDKSKDNEEYVGDAEFERKKKLFLLRDRFDRFKKDLEDEKDKTKKKQIQKEMDLIKNQFNELKKK